MVRTCIQETERGLSVQKLTRNGCPLASAAVEATAVLALYLRPRWPCLRHLGLFLVMAAIPCRPPKDALGRAPPGHRIRFSFRDRRLLCKLDKCWRQLACGRPALSVEELYSQETLVASVGRRHQLRIRRVSQALTQRRQWAHALRLQWELSAVHRRWASLGLQIRRRLGLTTGLQGPSHLCLAAPWSFLRGSSKSGGCRQTNFGAEGVSSQTTFISMPMGSIS